MLYILVCLGLVGGLINLADYIFKFQHRNAFVDSLFESCEKDGGNRIGFAPLEVRGVNIGALVCWKE